MCTFLYAPEYFQLKYFYYNFRWKKKDEFIEFKIKIKNNYGSSDAEVKTNYDMIGIQKWRKNEMIIFKYIPNYMINMFYHYESLFQ